MADSTNMKTRLQAAEEKNIPLGERIRQLEAEVEREGRLPNWKRGRFIHPSDKVSLLNLECLGEAVYRNDHEAVCAILARGGDFNFKEPYWNGGRKADILPSAHTPMWMAAVNGNADIVAELLRAGDRMDPLDGIPPIHVASRCGHVDVIRLLLEKGYDIQKSWSTGTPLHQAAIGGRPEAIRFLLDRGADLFITIMGGVTALDFARGLEKYWRSSHTLVRNELEMTTQAERNPEEIEKHKRYEEVVQILEEHVNRGPVEESNGHVEEGIRQLEANMDQLRVGPLTIVQSVCLNDLEAVRALLALGIDVDLETTFCDSGRTRSLIGVATENGNADILFELLRAGARVNPEQDVLWMYQAATSGYTDVLRLILQHSPDTVRHEGIMIGMLHQAVIFGRAETFRLLIQRGANPLNTNEDGDTLLDYASSVEKECRLGPRFWLNVEDHSFSRQPPTSEDIDKANRVQEVVEILEKIIPGPPRPVGFVPNYLVC